MPAKKTIHVLELWTTNVMGLNSGLAKTRKIGMTSAEALVFIAKILVKNKDNCIGKSRIFQNEMVNSLYDIVLKYILSEKSIYDVMQGDQPPEDRMNAVDVEKGKKLEY